MRVTHSAPKSVGIAVVVFVVFVFDDKFEFFYIRGLRMCCPQTWRLFGGNSKSVSIQILQFI